MPIIRGTRKINPLDLNDLVTIGVGLPLNEVNMFDGTKTTAEQIRTNILNVLLTEPNENLSDPNFGVGLQNLLFEQNIDLEILKERIQAQVSTYLGQVVINDITAKLSEDKHTIMLKLDYSYAGVEDSIQTNFS